MRNDVTFPAALCCLLSLALPLSAQDEPLSAIDWVRRNPAPETRPEQPPAAPARLRPDVAVALLENGPGRLIGLVPARVTGLPENLWRGSDPAQLTRMLRRLPSVRLPAAQTQLYALLLSEAHSPGNDMLEADRFSLARIETLQRLGALDPAMALAEQAGVTRDAAHFRAFTDIALLVGEEDSACTLQAAMPQLAPDTAHRIFCAVRTGDWSLAALLFESGRALGLFAPAMEPALERFLDPDFSDGLPNLPAPVPSSVTPLLFRVYEALGQPLPTRPLPRAYAVADLRDLAGWKAQLEAAERLVRAGALPANSLLGLYSQRQAAASGGIWDRVAAMQRFDTALGTRSADAVSKTLPDVWEAMREAGLEVAFATLFAGDLSQIDLEGFAGGIARDVAFIAPDAFHRDPDVPEVDNTLETLLQEKHNHPLAGAVALGFDAAPAPVDFVALAARNREGEALLRALALLEDGAAGDPQALTTGLRAFRALGQEKTALQAAAQVLVLGPFT